MKRYLLALGCACCITFSFGQGGHPGDVGSSRPSQRVRWKFRSDEYIGMTSGEMGGYGMFQTVNGLYNGPWFLGLGTGLDYYRYRSVPLFLSVTRDIPVAPKNSGLYLVANGGFNLPWYSRDHLPFGVVSSRFRPGIWWNTGLGYRWRLSPGSDKAVLISAAYGVKKLSEHQVGGPPMAPCPYCDMTPAPAPASVFDYDYVNRTWMLNIGFEF